MNYDTYKKQNERHLKRLLPIERETISKIYRLVKVGGDTELALSVSLQLQEYARLKELEKDYTMLTNRTDSEILHQIADNLND